MQSPSERNDGCTLVIMAKAPSPGMVKTRLARRIPVGAVTELYRCLLDDTLALARSLANIEVAIMCPAADAETLRQLETLAHHGLVVGPTNDGGYYLVGAKTAHASLFDGDGLGTQTALEALLERYRKLQLSVGFTDLFYDIDVEGDLTRLAAELRIAPNRAPRTAVWLKEWGRTLAELRTDTEDL